MQIYISRNNQQFGPFEESKILEGLRNGQFLPDDLAIRHGEREWKTLKTLYPNAPLPAPAAPVLSAPPPAAPKKSRKRLFLTLGGTFLFLLLLGGGFLAYYGYRNLNPVPTEKEIPAKIGDFTKKSLNAAKGDFWGSEKIYDATYEKSSDGKRVELNIIRHRYPNEILALLGNDLECKGKYEDEEKFFLASKNVGRGFYCNSDKPFYQLIYFSEVNTFSSPTGNMDKDELTAFAKMGLPSGTKAEPFK